MPGVAPGSKDGYLFAGNHLCLDLVNTRLVMDRQPVELLADLQALLRWFRAADRVPTAEMEAIRREWEKRPEAGACLEELRNLRESLRATLLGLEAAAEPASKTVTGLSHRQHVHPMSLELRQRVVMLEKPKLFEMRRPQNLTAPTVDVAAEILADPNPLGAGIACKSAGTARSSQRMPSAAGGGRGSRTAKGWGHFSRQRWPSSSRKARGKGRA